MLNLFIVSSVPSPTQKHYCSTGGNVMSRLALLSHFRAVEFLVKSRSEDHSDRPENSRCVSLIHVLAWWPPGSFARLLSTFVRPRPNGPTAHRRQLTERSASALVLVTKVLSTNDLRCLRLKTYRATKALSRNRHPPWSSQHLESSRRQAGRGRRAQWSSLFASSVRPPLPATLA